MLYVFVGEKSAREKASVMIKSLLAKKKDATLVRMAGDSLDAQELRFLAASQGLFSCNSIARIDGCFATRESATQIEPLLPALSASSNVFVLVDDKLLANDIKILKEYATEIKEYDSEQDKGKARNSGDTYFNIYSLTNAFAEREKRRAWLLYHEALASDIATEVVFWKLVWQTRVLLASYEGTAGLKAIGTGADFAKTERARAKWDRQELLAFHRRLLVLYHDFETFRSDPDLEFALERAILSI